MDDGNVDTGHGPTEDEVPDIYDLDRFTLDDSADETGANATGQRSSRGKKCRDPRKAVFTCKFVWCHNIPESRFSRVCIEEIMDYDSKENKMANGNATIDDVIKNNPFQFINDDDDDNGGDADDSNGNQGRNGKMEKLVKIHTPLYVIVPTDCVPVRDCPFLVWWGKFSCNLSLEALEWFAECGAFEAFCPTEKGGYTELMLEEKIIPKYKAMKDRFPDGKPKPLFSWSSTTKKLTERLKFRNSLYDKMSKSSVVRPGDMSTIRAYREAGCIEHEGIPNTCIFPDKIWDEIQQNASSTPKEIRRFLDEGMDWMLEEIIYCEVPLKKFSTFSSISNSIMEHVRLNWKTGQGELVSKLTSAKQIYANEKKEQEQVTSSELCLPPECQWMNQEEAGLLDFLRCFSLACDSDIRKNSVIGPASNPQKAITYSILQEKVQDMLWPLAWVQSARIDKTCPVSLSALSILMANYGWKFLTSLSNKQLKLLNVATVVDPAYLMLPLDFVFDAAATEFVDNSYNFTLFQNLQPISYKRYSFFCDHSTFTFNKKVFNGSMKKRLNKIRAAHLQIYNSALNKLYVTGSTTSLIVPNTVENYSTLAWYSNIISDMEELGLMMVDPMHPDKVCLTAALQYELEIAQFLLSATRKLHILEFNSLYKQYNNVTNYLEEDLILGKYLKSSKSCRDEELPPVAYIFPNQTTLQKVIWEEGLDQRMGLLMDDFASRQKEQPVKVLVILDAQIWGADVLWNKCLRHIDPERKIHLVMAGSPWNYRSVMNGFGTPFRTLCHHQNDYKDHWKGLKTHASESCKFWENYDNLTRNPGMITDMKLSSEAVRALCILFRFPEWRIHTGYIRYDGARNCWTIIDPIQKQEELDEDEGDEDEDKDGDDAAEEGPDYDDDDNPEFDSAMGHRGLHPDDVIDSSKMATTKRTRAIEEKKRKMREGTDSDTEEEEDEGEGEESDGEDRKKKKKKKVHIDYEKVDIKDPSLTDDQHLNAWLRQQQKIDEEAKQNKKEKKIEISTKVPLPPCRDAELNVIGDLFRKIPVLDKAEDVNNFLKEVLKSLVKANDRRKKSGSGHSSKRLIPSSVFFYTTNLDSMHKDYLQKEMSTILQDMWYDERMAILFPGQQIYVPSLGDLVMVEACYKLIPMENGWFGIPVSSCSAYKASSYIVTSKNVSNSHMSCCFRGYVEKPNIWIRDPDTLEYKYLQADGWFPHKHMSSEKISNGHLLPLRRYCGPAIRNSALFCTDKTTWRDFVTISYYTSHQLTVIGLDKFNMMGCLTSEFKGAAPETRLDYFLKRILRQAEVRNIPIYQQLSDFVVKKTDQEIIEEETSRRKKSKRAESKSGSARTIPGEDIWNSLSDSSDDEKDKEKPGADSDDEEDEIDNGFEDDDEDDAVADDTDIINEWTKGMAEIFSILPVCGMVDKTYLLAKEEIVDDFNMPECLASMSPEEKERVIKEHGPQERIIDDAEDDGDFDPEACGAGSGSDEDYDEDDDEYEDEELDDEYLDKDLRDEEDSEDEEDEDDDDDDDGEEKGKISLKKKKISKEQKIRELMKKVEKLKGSKNSSFSEITIDTDGKKKKKKNLQDSAIDDYYTDKKPPTPKPSGKNKSKKPKELKDSNIDKYYAKKSKKNPPNRTTTKDVVDDMSDLWNAD